MSRRRSFTEKRRARLAMKVDRLDRFETRNTMTEPISVLGLATSALRGLASIGIMQPDGGGLALAAIRRAAQATQRAQTQAPKAPFVPTNFVPVAVGLQQERPSAGAGHSGSGQGAPAKHPENADWLSVNLRPSSDIAESHGLSTPWHPARASAGGAAQAPRGSSGAARVASPASRGAVNALRLRSSTPAAVNPGSSAALLAAVAGASNGGFGNAGAEHADSVRPASSGQWGLSSTSGHPTSSPGPGQAAAALALSGGSTSPTAIPDPVIGNSSGPSMQSFTYFPMYVLDNNNGVVLMPGVTQLATLNGYVDLEAQVSGTTVSSYNWNISGLDDYGTISATNTYQLTWKWANSFATTHTDSVTLSVTDTNSHTETYTYDFWLPEGTTSGTGSGGGSAATWPSSLAPDQELDSAPFFGSDYASVDATSGALDTEIDLPGYNPNVPANDLTYDSLTANPMPIIIVENALSASAAVPSQVSATLTFNGTVGTTYYYNTSTLNPGDVQQIALQATSAASLSTGRYSYSVQVVDHGTSVTTTTYSGTTTILNQSSSAFGDGWTLDGLEQIIPATGGVILNLGDGGRSLWFTGSFSGGGTYTDPPGEFSTLVKASSGGGYTDTLTDGTKITFNSGGYETATIDLNGLHTTYSYNGSNKLTSITDPYNNITTFTYNSGGYLQTIEDPAGRITTLTDSSGALTEAVLPDGSTWNYSYDSGGRLTQITDPRSNTTTVIYDSAERVGTISSPNGTTEQFTNDQESGWTNSGTSGSPAPATLLAQATSTYTSPNGNATTLRPDWMGLAG